MRILALVTDAFGGYGGIARYNCDLLTALSQSQTVSSVLVLPRIGPLIAQTPAKVRQVAPVPSKFAWSGHAFKLVAKNRFDVIFCGHPYAAPLAASLAFMVGVPMWVQVHGVDAWEPRGKFQRYGMARATLVTSVSRYTRRELLAWSGLPPHRVRVLPNTVDPRYGPREPRADLIKRHNLAGKRVILTVGRLSEAERYKGHDRVIAVMPDVLARVPNAVYLIAGSGEDQSRLQAAADDAGVAGNVVFAGRVLDDELPDYFALANVFAMPSTGEGFGIVFLEAAASGLPVIGGNCDGTVDALGEGKIGRLIEPNSWEELAAALIDALEGREENAIAEVQRFRFENFSRHVDELLRDIAR